MKYQCNITINKPLQEVIQLFDNPANLSAWMPGLQAFDLIEGNPGEPGSRHRMTFLHKGKEVELVETILKRNLPEAFMASYESQMGYNEVTASFEAISPSSTRYTTDNFFEFKGFMKLMALLMPGAFRKQSMVYLKAFKEFAESK